jgi:hypothetical protein
LSQRLSHNRSVAGLVLLQMRSGFDGISLGPGLCKHWHADRPQAGNAAAAWAGDGKTKNRGWE